MSDVGSIGPGAGLNGYITDAPVRPEGGFITDAPVRPPGGFITDAPVRPADGFITDAPVRPPGGFITDAPVRPADGFITDEVSGDSSARAARSAQVEQTEREDPTASDYAFRTLNNVGNFVEDIWENRYGEAALDASKAALNAGSAFYALLFGDDKKTSRE